MFDKCFIVGLCCACYYIDVLQVAIIQELSRMHRVYTVECLIFIRALLREFHEAA